MKKLRENYNEVFDQAVADCVVKILKKSKDLKKYEVEGYAREFFNSGLGIVSQLSNNEDDENIFVKDVVAKYDEHMKFKKNITDKYAIKELESSILMDIGKEIRSRGEDLLKYTYRVPYYYDKKLSTGIEVCGKSNPDEQWTSQIFEIKANYISNYNYFYVGLNLYSGGSGSLTDKIPLDEYMADKEKYLKEIVDNLIKFVKDEYIDNFTVFPEWKHYKVNESKKYNKENNMSKLNENVYQGSSARFSKIWHVYEDAKYFFGDPGYVIDYEWLDVCSQMSQNEKAGIPCTYGTIDGDLFVALTKPAFGNGVYIGTAGISYDVDSSTLGIARLQDDRDLEGLGIVVDVEAGSTIKFSRDALDVITFEVIDSSGPIFYDTIPLNEEYNEEDDGEEFDESSKKKMTENYSCKDRVIVVPTNDNSFEYLENEFPKAAYVMLDSDEPNYVLTMNDVAIAIETVADFDECEFFDLPKGILDDGFVKPVAKENLDRIHDVFSAVFDCDELVNESEEPLNERSLDLIWNQLEKALREDAGISLKYIDDGQYVEYMGKTADIWLETDEDTEYVDVYLLTDMIEESGSEPYNWTYESVQDMYDEAAYDILDAIEGEE